ncbi:MAG: hypothetical protein FWD47_00150 [Treponema sp.]|nr:hypothetical protein [Treponema sp.]
MLKKGLLVLILAALVAGGAFAFDMSAGGGAVLGYNFGGGLEEKGILPERTEFPSFSIGAFGFIDLTYIEASVGFLYNPGDMKVTIPGFGSASVDFNTTSLFFSLLGKYPIDLGFLTVFPAAGIEYQLVLSAKMAGINANDAGDLSALWFRLGGGLDFSLGGGMYIRGTALYGLRLNNKFEKDIAQLFDENRKMGHGIQIRAAIGFNF